MNIVITGSPGVGKHTVAKEILNQLKLTLLDINKIAKDFDLFEPNKNTNDVDVEKLSSIIENRLSDSNLIVGHLAPYVVSPTKINKVIVLRKNPYELLEIYEKRRYSKEKAKENASSEILGIIMHDSLTRFKNKTFQLDTTGKSVKNVRDLIFKIINENHSSDEIDWLELVTKKGDLKKFFSY